jgi:hypothetical protein
VGQLNRPQIPALPGLERFRGPHFHSARWRHDVDLAGKSVAVVGNAASAIQLIPQIAPRVGRLHVFQRSANWMLPRLDRAYSEAERRRFARHPWLARLYRWWIWAQHELRFPVFRRNRLLGAHVERLARRSMRCAVADPRLAEALIPDYPIGGKRILISDDYYQALGRPNVEVVSAPIDHLTPDAVVTRDGRERRADVLIFATGFETTSFLAPMRIEGLDQRPLADEWKEGAHAYLGLCVAGFPNFFMMYGPNTNLGHNSILFMLECQARYIVACVRELAERDLAWLDLRRSVMEDYNRRLQRELSRTVWAATERSWYKTASGLITNNWSGSTLRYWWKTRRVDFRAYRREPRHAGAQRAPGSPARMRSEKSAEPAAAFAFSLMRLWARSSGKGRLVSIVPRSYIISSSFPFTRIRQFQGFPWLTSRMWWRIAVVQLWVKALYQRGRSASRLISAR